MSVQEEKKQNVPQQNTKRLIHHARECLNRHPHFRGRVNLFEITCDGQVLRVEGSVPSYYLKQMLGSALVEMEGHVHIENLVQVDGRDKRTSRP